MKKAIAIILLLSLSVFFAGCNKNDPAENKPSHGTVSGNTYTSDYTGLSITIPSDLDKWTFYSDEELAEGCGIDAQSYTTDFSQVLSNNKTVYDMMAISETYQMSILTGFENLTLAGEDPDMTGKAYVEKTVDAFVSGLNTEISTYTVTDTEKVTLCGHTYYRKVLTCTTTDTSGTTTLSEAYYVRNLGGYMSITLVFFPSNVTIEQVESMFN